MPRILTFPAKGQQVQALVLQGDGLSTDERRFWWPVLVTLENNRKEVTSYPNLQILVVKLAEAASKVKIQPAANNCFTLVEAFHILLRSHNIKDYKYLYNLYKLLQGEIETLSHGAALLYHVFDTILKSKSKYGDFTAVSLRRQEAVCRQILEKNATKTSQLLRQYNALDDHHLNHIFFSFFKHLLPPACVLRILDAYLMEGTRALYRYAAAFILEQKQHIKGNQYTSGDDFWGFLMKRKETMTSAVFQSIHNQAYEAELGLGSMFGVIKLDVSVATVVRLTAAIKIANKPGLGAGDAEENELEELPKPIGGNHLPEDEADDFGTNIGKGSDEGDDDEDEARNPILGSDDDEGDGVKLVEIAGKQRACCWTCCC